VAEFPFRSAPLLVRNPTNDPFLGASVQATLVRANGRCAGENIIIPPAQELTSPDRHVDPQTAALEDQVALETGAAASALVPGPTPSATPLTCDEPFADATADHVQAPDFPAAALAAAASAGVSVRVDLDASGHVTAATVIESSGNSDLDAAAIDAARKTTYRPAVFACQPQKSAHVMRFDFSK
jgi:protein TonB